MPGVGGGVPAVLRGRCHIRESVYLRAFDGVVDELTRLIARFPPELRREVCPAESAVLTRLFPVMARIEEFRGDSELEVDPQTLHRIGLAALRDLIARISRHRTVIFWIDDCQWADSESLELLKTLLSPPDAPPILIILSYREQSLETEAELQRRAMSFVAQLPEICEAQGVFREHLEIAPLDESESLELFGELCSGQQVDRQILATCEGNPLLIQQLSIEALVSRTELGVDWLERRINGLSADEQELLRLTSVAGHPLRLETLVRLVPNAHLLVEGLCSHQWLQLKIYHGEESYDAFHDRIRDAIASTVSPGQKQDCHKRIAVALYEDPSHAAVDLARHYAEAGLMDEAAENALLSAREAQASRAYERAAERFGWAYELRGSAAEDWWIIEKKGNALASCGRSAEAAVEYLKAAAAADEVEEDQDAAARLKVEAAVMQLRQGGRKDARESYLEASRALGVEPYASRHLLKAKLARLPWVFKPVGFVDKGPAPELVTSRLLLLRELAVAMSTVDAGIYWRLGEVWLQDSIASGDPKLAGDAANTEATLHSALGGVFRRSSRRLLEFSDRCLSSEQDYEYQKLLCAKAGIYNNEGRWRESANCGLEAVKTMYDQFSDQFWGRTVTHQFCFVGLSMLGELDVLQRQASQMLDFAHRLDDPRLISTYLLGQAAYAQLATGNEDQIEAYLLRYAPDGLQSGVTGLPPGALGLVNTGLLLLLMFRGDMEASKNILDSTVRWTARPYAVPGHGGFLMRYLRGLVCLSLAEDENRRPEMHKDVLLQIKYLKKHSIPSAEAAADYLSGELAAQRGNDARARKLMGRALVGFSEQEMRLFALAVERRLATMNAGVTDRVERIDEQIRSFGVEQIEGDAPSPRSGVLARFRRSFSLSSSPEMPCRGPSASGWQR